MFEPHLIDPIQAPWPYSRAVVRTTVSGLAREGDVVASIFSQVSFTQVISNDQFIAREVDHDR